MIATRRGLVVLVAIALLLGAMLAVDLARDRAPATRELVAGLDVADITALRWSWPDQPSLSLARARAATGWRIESPAGDADPATIDAAIAALRGARWHRIAAPRTAGATQATLAITAAGTSHTLGRGGSLDGGEQAWLVRDDSDAVLVDRWVIDALFPAPLALRVRAPLADVTGRVAFHRAGVDVEVDLSRGALVQPIALALAPDRVAAISDALAGLVIVHATSAPFATSAGLSIAAGARTVAIGDCPDAAELAGVRASSGDGCVTRASVAAVGAALSMLAGAPEAIADPRPLAAPPVRVELRDGATLDLAKRPQLLVPRLTPRGVDADRVAELVAALTAPGLVVARPDAQPIGAITATLASGETTSLELYTGDLVARHGEPVAIRIAPAAFAALAAPSDALLDASLWNDDATSIASIDIDGVVHARGAVFGEWTGASPPTAAQLDVLAEALAAPRAPRGPSPPPPAAGHAHRIVVEVRTPVATTRRELELEKIGARCALRTAQAAAWIDPAACAALP